MKRLFTLLSIMCTFVCIVACSSSKTPSSIVEQYAKAMKGEDFEAVAELFYSEGSEEEIAENRKMITGLLEGKVKPEMDKNGGIESYEIGEEVISEDGQSATVEFALYFGNGDCESQKSELVNVDGTWYLDAGK